MKQAQTRSVPPPPAETTEKPEAVAPLPPVPQPKQQQGPITPVQARLRK